MEDYEQTVAVDAKKPVLTANLFTYDRFTFVNWNTEPDGTGLAFSDKQNVSAFYYEDGTKIDLYAQWHYNMTTLDYHGTDFIIVDTALPVEYFAAYTEANGICQTAGTDKNVYDGKCLAFAKYYCGCLIKGNSDIRLRDGYKGNRLGVGVYSKRSKDLQAAMNILYQQLNTGKPQILMVSALQHWGRHFVTVVGYKAGVESGETMQPEDLLIIDTYDGKLESMDPDLYPDDTRMIFAQSGKYRIDITR